jgi:hypothetical protein
LRRLSHGDYSFRLNFSFQGWQENLPMSDYFWLREAQFERIKPYFPLSHGVPRVDDRRVVSGIIHVIRNGLRWRDAPEVYGPHRPFTTGSRVGPAWVCLPVFSRTWLPMMNRSIV